MSIKEKEQPICINDIYNDYYNHMLNICRKYTNDLDTAKEYCQLGFINFYNRVDDLKSINSVPSYLRTVIKNTILDEKRKEKSLKNAPIHATKSDKLEYFVEDIKEECETNDIRIKKVNRIKKAMSFLPPKQRHTFKLYHIEGMKHKEISKLLDISESTSKTNLMRAKKKIMVYLSNE